MNKERALHIAMTAIMREILRDEDAPGAVATTPGNPQIPEDPGPQPRFDFDESDKFCIHGGLYIPREDCPVHGPSSEVAPTAEELDDQNSDEPPRLIQRAQRIREQREAAASTGRLFPEDLPMHGMAPPPEEPPPNLVV